MINKEDMSAKMKADEKDRKRTGEMSWCIDPLKPKKYHSEGIINIAHFLVCNNLVNADTCVANW